MLEIDLVHKASAATASQGPSAQLAGAALKDKDDASALLAKIRRVKRRAPPPKGAKRPRGLIADLNTEYPEIES